MTSTTGTPDHLKEQPWPDVLRALGEELRDFVQQEMQLAKAELSSKVKQAGMGAGMFGAAGFMGFLAAGALTAGLILALGLVVPAWVAAFIVTGSYGLIAAVLALIGKKKVKAATPLAPEQALRTIQSAKAQLQQAWERGSLQAASIGGDAMTSAAGMVAAAAARPPAAPAAAAPEQPAPSAGTAPSRTSPPRY